MADAVLSARRLISQQLDVGYPTSTLSLDERDDDAPIRAGYHAPDAPCVGADGQPVRLFSLLKEGRWLLLRYEPATRQPAMEARSNLRIISVGSGVSAELTDPHGHLRSAYGFAPGDICLIRPDGYIAALTHDERSPGLGGYLTQVGLQDQP